MNRNEGSGLSIEGDERVKRLSDFESVLSKIRTEQIVEPKQMDLKVIDKYVREVDGTYDVDFGEVLEAYLNEEISEADYEILENVEYDLGRHDEQPQHFLRFFLEDGEVEDVPLFIYNRAYTRTRLFGEPFEYQGVYANLFKVDGVAYQYINQGFFGWAGVAHGNAVTVDGLNAGEIVDVITGNGEIGIR